MDQFSDAEFLALGVWLIWLLALLLCVVLKTEPPFLAAGSPVLGGQIAVLECKSDERRQQSGIACPDR